MRTWFYRVFFMYHFEPGNIGFISFGLRRTLQVVLILRNLLELNIRIAASPYFHGTCPIMFSATITISCFLPTPGKQINLAGIKNTSVGQKIQLL